MKRQNAYNYHRLVKKTKDGPQLEITNEILKIFIKLYVGNTIEINLKYSDNIKFIKQLIQEQENIPYSYQRLMFINTELDVDNKTCKDYGIKNLSTILCETKILLVTTPAKKIISIPLQPLETAQSVKKKIQDQVGIPKIKQRLFYPCCSYRGKKLKDADVISQSNIKGHLIHMLEVESLFGVFIEILESTRTVVYIAIQESDTIKSLKAKISDKASLQVNNYKLFFMDNELEDEKSLNDYGIQNETTLQLCQYKLIYIQKFSDDKLPLEVERLDTIDEIKTKINNFLKIPYRAQSLYFHGQKLQNFKTLAEYNIGFGMKLRLKVGIQIFIVCSLKPKIKLEMQLTDTIVDIKKYIQDKLGFPIHNQQIEFNNIKLKDNKQLMDCGIKEYSNLHLMIHAEKPMQIIISYESKKYFLELNPRDTIKFIKSQCEKEFGISMKTFDLYHFSIRLNENESLETYDNIKNQSTLRLINKNDGKMLIFVDFLGSKISVKVSPNTYVKALRKKIQEIKGIPESDGFRLLYDCRPITDYETFSELGITTGSTIEVILIQAGC